MAQSESLYFAECDKRCIGLESWPAPLVVSMSYLYFYLKSLSNNQKVVKECVGFAIVLVVW